MLKVPFRVSSKQCRSSWCDVKIRTLWPLSSSPTAASTIKRSAPPLSCQNPLSRRMTRNCVSDRRLLPIPRSGCMNAIFISAVSPLCAWLDTLMTCSGTGSMRSRPEPERLSSKVAGLWMNLFNHLWLGNSVSTQAFIHVSRPVGYETMPISCLQLHQGNAKHYQRQH